MQLNLSRRQRMNFSMMYKGIFSLIFALLILMSAPVKKCCAKELIDKFNQEKERTEETQENYEGKKANLLLLHGKQMNEGEKKNLMLLIEMLSGMIKSVEYGTYEEEDGKIADQDYIICYCMDEEEIDCIQKIHDKQEKKVFIIGTSFLASYLKYTHRSSDIRTIEEREEGILSYTFGEMEEFTALVHVTQAAEFRRSSYQNGSIEIGRRKYPFVTQIDELRYIPYVDLHDNLTYLALSKELTAWMWIYKNLPPRYVQYIVLDEVYPFMPAQRLLDQVEVLVKEEIPFVITVMPIYHNSDYPAMQQFCEVLRYAQDHGGAVLLRMPILRIPMDDLDTYYKILTDVTMAYNQYGVYLLGIEVPQSVLTDELSLTWMRRYKTVFVYDDGMEAEYDKSCHRNKVYYNYHTLVMPLKTLDDSGTNYAGNYAAALYINTTEATADEVEEIAVKFKRSDLFTKSLWEMSHSVWANDYHLSYEQSVLKINDEIQELTYEPKAYNERYDYKRNILKRVSVNIQNQSRELIVLVTIVTVVFCGMILYARRVNRRLILGERIRRKDRK